MQDKIPEAESRRADLGWEYENYLRIYSNHFPRKPVMRRTSFHGLEYAAEFHHNLARAFSGSSDKTHSTLAHYETALELTQNPQVKKDFFDFLYKTPSMENFGYKFFCAQDVEDPNSKGCGARVKTDANYCWNCREPFAGFLQPQQKIVYAQPAKPSRLRKAGAAAAGIAISAGWYFSTMAAADYFEQIPNLSAPALATRVVAVPAPLVGHLVYKILRRGR